jgi:hypothetical protein
MEEPERFTAPAAEWVCSVESTVRAARTAATTARLMDERLTLKDESCEN